MEAAQPAGNKDQHVLRFRRRVNPAIGADTRLAYELIAVHGIEVIRANAGKSPQRFLNIFDIRHLAADDFSADRIERN
jgi:hypothetical protein